MPRLPKPEESTALKARTLLVWATLAELSAKSQITAALNVRARTWDRWVSGRSAAPRYQLLDMAAKLLSENPKFSLSKQLEGDSNPEGKAWDWLIESLAERAKTTTNVVLRLLDPRPPQKRL